MSEQTNKRFFSLKYKMLIALILVPLLSLSFYAVFSSQYFESDKKAYALDTTTAIARSLAKQLGQEFDMVKFLTNQVLGYTDFTHNKFESDAQKIFNSQDKIISLIVYSKRPNANDFTRNVLTRPGQAGAFLTDTSLSALIRKELAAEGYSFRAYKQENMYILSYKLLVRESEVEVIVLFKSKLISSDFQGNELYNLVIYGRKGLVYSFSDHADILHISEMSLSKIVASKLPEGSFIQQVSGGAEFISAYSNIGLTGLRLAAFVDGESIFMPIKILKARTFFFFLIVLSLSALISLILATKFTSSLTMLYGGIRKVSEGQFDIELKAQSNDEVGRLAIMFAEMAKKIETMLKDEVKMGRMETELKTVNAVQETLIPKENSRVGALSLSSIFISSSECGGDWWHYYTTKDEKVHFCIGDVTGHGAAAAMVTAAARSASALIEHAGEDSPAEILKGMNRAIFYTTKTSKMMTFFHAKYDQKTRQLTHSNASHEFPILVKMPKDGVHTKANFDFVYSKPFSRLGEKIDIHAEDSSLYLESGDTLVLFTDGILDIRKANGNFLGEGGFIRLLIKAFNSSKVLEKQVEYLHHQIKQYQKETPFSDDVTFLAVRLD